MDSDLPIVNKFNLSFKEIKQNLENDRSLTRDQLVLIHKKK